MQDHAQVQQENTKKHKELNILNLQDRRDLHTSMECCKSVNDNNYSLASYFKPIATRTTRAGETRMALPSLKTSIGKKAFSYRGPDHWDKLPAIVKSAQSVNTFKSSYLKNLFHNENHPT